MPSGHLERRAAFPSAVRDGTEKRPGEYSGPEAECFKQKGALQFSRWTRLSAGNEEEFGGLERVREKLLIIIIEKERRIYMRSRE